MPGPFLGGKKHIYTHTLIDTIDQCTIVVNMSADTPNTVRTLSQVATNIFDAIYFFAAFQTVGFLSGQLYFSYFEFYTVVSSLTPIRCNPFKFHNRHNVTYTHMSLSLGFVWIQLNNKSPLKIIVMFWIYLLSLLLCQSSSISVACLNIIFILSAS